MSLSYCILLSGIMLFWASMFKVVHLSAYDWQEKQIAVDNAATVMGQLDRTLFNNLIAYNRRVKLAEISHHLFHTCKSNPYTKAYCEPMDLAAEYGINLARNIALNMAKGLWQLSRVRGLSELAKYKAVYQEWERPTAIPVHTETCSVCGLETYIEIDKTPVTTFIRAKSKVPIGVLAEVGGTSLKKDTQWNYRLKTAEERL